MRCLTCEYDLSNLTSDDETVHRCPECGRIFDAADPETFSTSTDSWDSFDFGMAVLLLIGATSPWWIYLLFRWATGGL